MVPGLSKVFGAFGRLTGLSRGGGVFFSGVAVILFMTGCGGNGETSADNFPPARIPPPPIIGSVESPKDDESIKTGDALEIFVKEDKSFNGIYQVRERGDIIIPSVGRIPVAGLSVSGAGDAIKRVLEQSQLQEATLIVDRVRRAQVGVSGADSGSSAGPTPVDGGQRIVVLMTGKVNRPGQHSLQLKGGRPIGVYEAILMAGGVSRFADDQKIHLLRKGDDGKNYRIPVDVTKIEAGEVPDPAIGDGDIIVVPEKVFGF